MNLANLPLHINFTHSSFAVILESLASEVIPEEIPYRSSTFSCPRRHILNVSGTLHIETYLVLLMDLMQQNCSVTIHAMHRSLFWVIVELGFSNQLVLSYYTSTFALVLFYLCLERNGIWVIAQPAWKGITLSRHAQANFIPLQSAALRLFYQCLYQLPLSTASSFLNFWF